MSTTLTHVEGLPIVLHLAPVIEMSDEQFFRFCQLNRDLRLERTCQGDVLIMPPTGGETGRTNFNLTGLMSSWVHADDTGIGFDSSTGFTLPNGAIRSPDFAWIRRERWDALTPQQRAVFPPLCPDFVVEIRSRTDSLVTLQAKMQEYLANGAQLGWLLDPLEHTVYVYRPQAPIERLEHPRTIVGDPILPGLVLDLDKVWH